MQRKLRDCFDLARELFAYAHHSGTEESAREFEKLKAQFDREVRRRASARPPKRPVSDCLDLARQIEPYTFGKDKKYEKLIEQLDRERDLRQELFAKPITLRTLVRRIKRVQPGLIEDIALENSLIGFYERVEL